MRVEVFYWNPFHVLLDAVNITGRDHLTGLPQELHKVFDSQVDLSAADDDQIRCELVWRLLGNNGTGTKPDGFQDRTMSVGDLIRFDGDNEQIFQAFSAGFGHVTDTDLETLDYQLEMMAITRTIT
jgi:hypothetical protein